MPSLKQRREQWASQLPFGPGRPVAFRQPAKVEPSDGQADTWIMARIVRCIGQDRTRYEVQDTEDDGRPGPTYNTTLRSIIPMPWPQAPTVSQQGWPAREIPLHSSVLAVFPDTSCFYPAIVAQTPSQNGSGKRGPAAKFYRLRFDDDDELERTIGAQFIVDPS